MLIWLGLYKILKQNLNDLESIIFPFFLRIEEKSPPPIIWSLFYFLKFLLEYSWFKMLC